jgi:methyl-accepting chemotaxis protein
MDESLLIAFATGGLAGLSLTFYVWWRAWTERRILQAELKRLTEHLRSHIELSHEGNAQRKDEIERLRKANENLRITVKQWQQRPDRRELRTLHVYDHAARSLMKRAPGFAAHWESALEEAEALIQQEDSGILAFARRLVLPRPRVSVRGDTPGNDPKE